MKPNATKAEKDQVRQKLEAIRKEILAGTISFAAAANKYSDDPANTGGAGGDLDYFTLDSGFVEEFAEAAFKLKKGEISEPVETPFGIHLIQVTDRQEGRLPDFEKSKPYIAQAYGMQLQKQIVTAERKTAKIDIKPMPKDLFPPATARERPRPGPGRYGQAQALIRAIVGAITGRRGRVGPGRAGPRNDGRSRRSPPGVGSSGSVRCRPGAGYRRGRPRSGVAGRRG